MLVSRRVIKTKHLVDSAGERDSVYVQFSN